MFEGNCVAKAASDRPGYSVMFQHLIQLMAFPSRTSRQPTKTCAAPSRAYALTTNSDGATDENEQNISRAEVG